jgi:hypothetical protein
MGRGGKVLLTDFFKKSDLGKVLTDVSRMGTGENHMILVANDVVSLADDVGGLTAMKKGPWPSLGKMFVPAYGKTERAIKAMHGSYVD